MARPPRPRWRAGVSLVLEVAADTQEEADRRVAELAELIKLRAATTVRNDGSRTDRVVVDAGVTLGEASAV